MNRKKLFFIITSLTQNLAKGLTIGLVPGLGLGLGTFSFK